MIDLFSLGVTHVLLLVAAWRLVRRPDLDADGAEGAARRSWGADARDA